MRRRDLAFGGRAQRVSQSDRVFRSSIRTWTVTSGRPRIDQRDSMKMSPPNSSRKRGTGYYLSSPTTPDNGRHPNTASENMRCWITSGESASLSRMVRPPNGRFPTGTAYGKRRGRNAREWRVDNANVEPNDAILQAGDRGCHGALIIKRDPEAPCLMALGAERTLGRRSARSCPDWSIHCREIAWVPCPRSPWACGKRL
ncbi:hypothetical protein Pan216_02600 [Planctomycetes bacterium Pan216]|uniref:Uncharacterized protein n=1 Tax=Kolteria novifilia TaxID=2527975 RepID=A0A518AXH7_9BACT|nr:hypothetical protein Pan216_02600 [Planctomycetes bacterium Pan216]